MLFELRESPETFVEVSFPIEPPVNVAPRAWPTIDHRQIGFADEFIERPVGLREEIAQLDFGLGRNAREAIADAAGRAVVTLSKTDSEEQDFFHSSLGKRRPKRDPERFRGKFNGYLHPAK